ncbi:MAG: hypothetical protein NZ581_09105, partial [Candidatus Caldarchaeum sp.]|nr:hypothetical protein [Candidatus Caldarchaeum sp.]MDW8436330.1 hypothetical protein [Candidatus Caldarchaeum sp.]
LFRPQRTIWTFSRIALASLIMVFVIVVSVFPVGKGLVLPRASTQVGVTESVEALLDKSQKNDLSLLLEKFNLTHLVFPVGPEAVMFGGDYGKSFRFKLTNEAWTEEDLRTIASQLKKHGIRPVLGIYLRTTYISVHYGYHGYNSSHFITEFSDCVDEKVTFIFNV